MIALKIFLWILAGLGLTLAGVLVLLLLLLSVSYGIRLTNRRGGTDVSAKAGFFSYRLSGRKPPSEAKKEKRALRKKKKAARTLQKLRDKAAKPKKRKKINRKKAVKTMRRQAKKERPTVVIRALLASLADYDKPYLKLIKVKRLHVRRTVGGGSASEVAANYAREMAIAGASLPVLLSIFDIKKPRVRVEPDFAGRKYDLKYDIILTLRPISLLFAALAFLKAFRRNKEIYRTKEEADTDGKETRAA